MAIYKVPQDVEAEDKLVGPFSFRQFIYLLIAGGAGGLTALFFNAPIPVPFFSILTVPVCIGFLVLALPLRKDQPMEIYLIAILRFMFKPKRRLWMADGTSVGMVIDAPAVIQQHLGKDLTQDEAIDRLTYLSRIVDTRGWAAKGVDVPRDTTVNAFVANEAASAEDVLDENNGLSRSFDDLIARQKEQSRSEAIERMQALQQNAAQQASQPAASISTPAAAPPQSPLGQNPVAPANDQPGPEPAPSSASSQARPSSPVPNAPGALPRLHYSPYPSMHQHVLTPMEEIRQHASAKTRIAEMNNILQPQKDMTPTVSPDIMRLANNNDLSIQAIANEAHRLSKDDGEEVVIKLH